MIKLDAKYGSSRRRPSKSAFYADENVPRRLIELIRAKGYRVALVPKERQQEPDLAQLFFASKERLILLTADKDFRGYMFPPRRILESFGVVVFQTADPSPATYQYLATKLLSFLRSNHIKGKICLVSTAGVRIKVVEE